MYCAVGSCVSDPDGFSRSPGDGGVPSGRDRYGHRMAETLCRSGGEERGGVRDHRFCSFAACGDGWKCNELPADPVCSDLQIYDGVGANTVLPTKWPVARSTVCMRTIVARRFPALARPTFHGPERADNNLDLNRTITYKLLCI